MQEEFKLFYSTALDEKDLNNLKILISNLNLKLTKDRDFYNSNKNKYRKNKLTKEALKQSRHQLINTKKELDAITSTKVFKNNLKNAKILYKNVAKLNDPQDLLKAKRELERARLLLKEFKFACKENGKRADVDKLSDIAISIKNLSYRYNPEFPLAVNNVSFEIKGGEYVTIIGHNGSGKSTLSKILIGVFLADEGTLKIFGNEVNKDSLDKIRKFLGIVFQNPDNQFIGSTVRSDIAFGLENKRVDPKLMEGIILEAAQKVRMEKFLDKEPLNLSGGQKQRVAIASTLALNPDIIIFDEATSMLDPKGKREIKEIMVELRKKLNKTIISITHDMDEILNADKVIVMNKGQMVKMGTPLEVLKDKDFLRSIQLNIPFVGLVEEALQKEGFKVEDCKNIDELVNAIC